MFLLGTLVPLVSLDSTARDIFQSLVGVIDLFGIYYAINQTVGKPTIKVNITNILIFILIIELTTHMLKKFSVNLSFLSRSLRTCDGKSI